MSQIIFSMGEIHTGLLQNSAALTEPVAVEMLRTVGGQQVRTSRRPNFRAVSPELLTGIDCEIAARAEPRAVGTVVSRALVTGGRIVQGSAYTHVSSGLDSNRERWGHYLARPGTIDIGNGLDARNLAQFFLDREPGPGVLSLGAIADRIMGLALNRAVLDRGAALKSSRTRLRWAVVIGDSRQGLVFADSHEANSTIRLPYREVDIRAYVEFCEDLALHEWLRTTLLALLDKLSTDNRAVRASMPKLRPTVIGLLSLWMPGARTHESLEDFWAALDHRPGLSRQWHNIAGHLRDHLGMSQS